MQNGEALATAVATPASPTTTACARTRLIRIGAFWSIHRFRPARDPTAASSARITATCPPSERPVSRSRPPGINYFVPDNFTSTACRLSCPTNRNTRVPPAPGSPSAPGTPASNSAPALTCASAAGSVLGADHLAPSGGLAKSGLQTGGLVRELQTDLPNPLLNPVPFQPDGKPSP